MNYRELADVLTCIHHLEAHGLQGTPAFRDVYAQAVKDRDALLAPPPPKKEPEPEPPREREAPARWPAQDAAKKPAESHEDHFVVKREHHEPHPTQKGRK